MAQNIKINGVTYNSVSSLSIPLNTGGGNAVFPDTSDATAAAGDIADGKTAYVNGIKLTGTGTGSGNYQSKSVKYTSNGSDTVTPDSGYDGLSSVKVTVDVSGGSAPTIKNASIQYASIQFYQPSNMFGTCNLENIQFSNCAIEKACFSNISLEYCYFAYCSLNNVSFEGATIDGETGTSADNIVLYAYMDTSAGSIILPSGATYSK